MYKPKLMTWSWPSITSDNEHMWSCHQLQYAPKIYPATTATPWVGRLLQPAVGLLASIT